MDYPCPHDALYFSVVTVATVGYGDFTPQTVWGKLFTIVYLAVGVGIFVALAGKLALGVLLSPPQPTASARNGAGAGDPKPKSP